MTKYNTVNCLPEKCARQTDGITAVVEQRCIKEVLVPWETIGVTKMQGNTQAAKTVPLTH